MSTKILGYQEFKAKLKDKLKPIRVKHHSYGNTPMSRIRLNRSDFKLYKFIICQAESPQCDCSATKESSLHFLVVCFFYSYERQTLYSQFEYYIPNFKTLTKKRKYEILVFGIHPENKDYNYTNIKNSFAVPYFILKKRRFS